MAVLRVTNIPVYIGEAEFKRVWTQPGLEIQSCNLTKGPNAEYASQQMYNGWQGYGNPEGIRIDFADETGGIKREREEEGADDLSFKQGRLMAGNGMGVRGPGGFHSGGQNPGLGRPSDGAYDPLQPGLGSGDSGQGVQQGNFGGIQTSQPANGFGQAPGTQTAKPSFLGGPLQQAQNAPASQPFPAQVSGGFNMPHRETQQPRLLGQPAFGQQAGVQQNVPHQINFPPFQQQPQSGQGPQMNQGSSFQQPPQGYTNQAFDPRLQQNQGSGTSQGQQQQPPAQQIPGQLLPQQIASLADVLGPLLQQTSGASGQLPAAAAAQLAQQASSGLVDQLQQHFAQAPPQQFQGQQAQMQQPNAQQPQMVSPAVQQQMQPIQVQQPQMQQPQMQGPPVQHPPGVIPKQDTFQQEQLPPDAVQTLYVDGMPLDVSKREMAHIFRPFEGYREIRIVEKKDKHGNPLVLSFVEFETPHQANTAMKTLQGYPIDLATPNEGTLRVCFAKPFKPNDPRSRAPGGAPPGRMQNTGQRQPGEGVRPWDGRGERRDEIPPGQRMGRDTRGDSRDRRDRPGPQRRFSDRPERRPEERRPVPGDRRR